MLRYSRISLLLALLVAGFCLAQVGDQCAYDLKGAKKQLVAGHGDKKNFDFQSLSLLMPSGKSSPRRIERIVENKHLKNTLGFEWKMASMDPVDILPLTCFQTNQPTYLGVTEDKTVITYGPAGKLTATTQMLLPKEKVKKGCDEPVRDSVDEPGEGDPEKYPLLDSWIRGSTVNGSFIFRFTCDLRNLPKDTVSLEVSLENPPKNKKEAKGPSFLDSVYFTCPDLERDSLSKLGVKAVGDSSWKAVGTDPVYFTADKNPKWIQKFSVSKDDCVERAVKITLYTKEKKKLGSGSVTVFLPAPKPKRD